MRVAAKSTTSPASALEAQSRRHTGTAPEILGITGHPTTDMGRLAGIRDLPVAKGTPMVIGEFSKKFLAATDA
jgi:hypothetical protein